MISSPSVAGPSSRRGTSLAVMLAGQVMVSMDGSIVSVTAPTIRAELQASAAQIQLLLSGYLLTTGVLFVTCARLGDILGHRRTFLIGLTWFTVASLLCGLAPDGTSLVLARVVQAMGAALLMPQVFSLIQSHWHGRKRRRAIGVYSMVLAVGVALGQVVGGLIIGMDWFGLSWRPVFLINVPIGVAVLVIGRHALPHSTTDEATRLDPLGVALLSAAMTAIIMPLIFGREQHWPGWLWIVLTLGVVLFVIFVRYESVARHPVFDFAALRPRGVRLGLASCCILMGCYTVFILTLTLHLQSELGWSAIRSGLTFTPYAVGFGALSLCWNLLPSRLQRMLPLIGPLVLAAGTVSVVPILRAQSDSGLLFIALLVAGMGHAAGYSPLISHVSSLAEPRFASAISAMNATGPVLAEVVGVAGLGTVYFVANTSADGLFLVTVAMSALLVLAALFATLMVLPRRSQQPARSA